MFLTLCSDQLLAYVDSESFIQSFSLLSERRHLHAQEALGWRAKAGLIYPGKVKSQGGRSCLATIITCA